MYTTTQKNKLESTQLKSFLPYFGLVTWRRIIYANSFLSSYLNLEKYKLTKHFSIIFLLVWSCGCTAHHSPGMNRKVRGTRLIVRPCPEHYCFCVSARWKLDHKGTTRRSYRLVLYTRSQNHNSALLSSLSNSIRRHKRNVLLLRNVTWYSLPVAGACNLLNQISLSLHRAFCSLFN